MKYILIRNACPTHAQWNRHIRHVNSIVTASQNNRKIKKQYMTTRKKDSHTHPSSELHLFMKNTHS